MVINNGSVQYNGGFHPDIILYCTIVLTLLFPSKRFDNFPPCLGDAQKVDMRTDFL